MIVMVNYEEYVFKAIRLLVSKLTAGFKPTTDIYEQQLSYCATLILAILLLHLATACELNQFTVAIKCLNTEMDLASLVKIRLARMLF